jgi:hypothetical protein
MRRLSIAVLAGVLLAGLVAAPAAADRDVDNGNIPHYSFVWAAGTFLGAPLVRELPTGDWAEFGNGWGTVTEAQRAHFLETVKVEIERDGVLQDFSTSLFTEEGAEFPFGVTFTVLIKPGAANTVQDWMMRWTFTEDHDDGSGFDPIPAGTVAEMPRTIVWTPRGQFPSGDYPPSDF